MCSSDLVTAGLRPEFLPDPEVLARLTNFNPRAEVFLPPESRALVPVTNGCPATARVLGWTAHRVDVEVRADAPAMLVLAQTHYPCWQATVAGQPASIHRANHGFQAVVVPAGTSHVRLRVVDRALQFGAAISLAALAVAGWLWRRSN